MTSMDMVFGQGVVGREWYSDEWMILKTADGSYWVRRAGEQHAYGPYRQYAWAERSARMYDSLDQGRFLHRARCATGPGWRRISDWIGLACVLVAGLLVGGAMGILYMIWERHF